MASVATIDLSEVAHSLGIPGSRVEAVVELLEAGNTVPFITRYRKDQTGALDEEQIRAIQSRFLKMRMLAERKQTILRSIESQGKLTGELAAAIQAADTTKRLEDLYLPFKPKKQTLATTARTRGLEPLANEILAADPMCANLDARAADFVNTDKKVASAADALLGAGHILAEMFSERADFRGRIRVILEQSGKLVSTGIVAVERDKDRPAAKGADATAEQADTAPADDAGAHDGTNEPIADEAPRDEAEHEQPTSDTGGEAETNDELALPSAEAAAPPSEEMNEAAAPVEEPSDELAMAPPTESPPSDGTNSHAPAAVMDAATDAPPAEPTEASGDAAPTTVAPVETAPAVARVTVSAADRKRERQQYKADKRKADKAKRDEWKLKAFRDYFQYREALSNIPPHRILAINRGERARALRVRLEYDLDAMHAVIDELLAPAGHPHADFLRGCARDALARLVIPSLERDMRREMTDRAEARAVEVFARNLRNLLLQPPVRDRRVLAIDPGQKSGCKLCALDEFGNSIEHALIFLVGKPERREEAKVKLLEMVRAHNLSVVAIGNGTGCRETEQWLSDVIASEPDLTIGYCVVNEAGASVYSTSRLGREEFPQYDATLRGAISIGRRLQDPLSELVKIEPPSIGVGLYQHDVKAKHLRDSLDAVVESCVNFVGVDLNTASSALLRYVSGLNQLTAQRVFDHRREHGPFKRREDLKEVSGFGESTFVQAAGFLKIAGGDNPLDATWIHPESYATAEKVLERLGFTPADLADKEKLAQLSEKSKSINFEQLAAELGAGGLTLADIVSQLARPGRDPREALTQPMFKKGVLKLDDLAAGMELTGTVLNVVDFGAFVDIGLKDTGLVHISQLANKYVEDPHSVVAVGDIVKVWVIEVDRQRRRVSLTMISPESRKQQAESRRAPRPARAEGTSGGAPRGGTNDRAGQARGARPPRPAQSKNRFFKRNDGAAAGQGNAPAGQGRDNQTQSQPPRPKPPKVPPKPLSKAKLQGRTPLRTFGELFQFVTHKEEEPKAADDTQPSQGAS